MPRKAFFAELDKLRESCPWDTVSGIRRGHDDMFYFRVTAPVAPEIYEQVEITCLVLPELAEYPTGHHYQMFLEDDKAPDSIANTIQNLPPMNEYSLSDAIGYVTKLILNEGNTTKDESQNNGSNVGEGSDYPDDDEEEEQDFESDGEENENFWIPKQNSFPINSQASEPMASGTDLFSKSAMQDIRIDLAMAKTAGFKVAYYGNIFRCPMNFHLCLAIRISKLGISEDAMEAWKVEKDDYLILAFCFKNGYKRLETILTDNFNSVRYKIGLSKTYKPSYTCLTGVFSEVGKYSREEWRSTFISKPLEELMNKRFFFILRNRTEGLAWNGAERLYHAQAGHQSKAGLMPDSYKQPDQVHGTYPEVVTYDHFTDPLGYKSHRSFPLLAMQFLLRHFVRCTEFCLVCHRPLDKIVQAIKPYVCDEPLCLYQYMSLGFGPGIEHEILTQPLVVDLLISFAWAAAKGRRVLALPRGLGLLVPSIHLLALKGTDFCGATHNWGRFHQFRTVPQPDAGLATPPNNPPPLDAFEGQEVMVNWNINQLFFEFGKPHHLSTGMWLAIISKGESEETNLMHCRIVKTYPDRVEFTEPFSALDKTLKSTSIEAVRVIKYDQNFDEMSIGEAQSSLLLQINLLPSVEQMEAYLRQNPTRTLADWHDRLSPAAIGILRWIIASNRACIKEDNDDSIVKDINGMKQFRFTMGAPDKEKRFVDEVLETKKRLDLTYPTILAFHGSPLYNWHGIIREGLHFKDTLHGRAFGHGVYHSLNFDVSNGYARSFSSYQSQFEHGDCWNRSKLLLQGAVAINEIVNAPAEFVNVNPHLVIDKVDWIQTRYLLVTCKEQPVLQTDNEQGVIVQQVIEIPELAVVDGFVQDPSKPLAFPQQKSFAVLPLRAGSYTRLLRSEDSEKRKRKAQVLESPAGGADDDSCSIATLDEDDEIFIGEPLWQKFAQVKNQPSRAALIIDLVQVLQAHEENATASTPNSSTNFVPGSLDHITLPRLPPPVNASTAASKTIMSALKSIQTTLETENIVELGWYVDVQQVDNIFQWIVELHSFSEDLLLTKQMIEQKIPSIVIEMRFPDQFPFAPPFARVVRPRMLPFASGGGGHVTAGGSICMELLTASGWSPALSIMNVLLNIRLAICELEPYPAQLDLRILRNRSNDEENAQDYRIGEAVDGYMRACRAHGWAIPDGFREWSMSM